MSYASTLRDLPKANPHTNQALQDALDSGKPLTPLIALPAAIYAAKQGRTTDVWRLIKTHRFEGESLTQILFAAIKANQPEVVTHQELPDKAPLQKVFCFAAECGVTPVVQHLLLSPAVKPNADDYRAIKLAIQNSHREVVSVLSSYVINTDVRAKLNRLISLFGMTRLSITPPSIESLSQPHHLIVPSPLV